VRGGGHWYPEVGRGPPPLCSSWPSAVRRA
jgi:hypothetical protein